MAREQEFDADKVFNNQVDQLANILDERSIWQRYGF